MVDDDFDPVAYHTQEAESYLDDARRLYDGDKDITEADVEFAKLNAALSLAHSNLAFVYKL